MSTYAENGRVPGKEEDTTGGRESNLEGSPSKKVDPKGEGRSEKTNLADSEDIVDVQALEERPHGKIDIDQATPKVEPARKAGDDLKTRVARLVLATSIKLDQVARARCGMGENLGDLEGV
jgi:hypothetical protein